MNIFATSKYPRSCARHLDDKRLNKMILETTQIICAVINIREGGNVTPYKTSHSGHPAVKWAMSSDDNVRWLYELGIAYGKEIIYRFGRKHSCHLVLEGLTFKWSWVEDAPKFMCGEVELYSGARHKGLGLDFTHLLTVESYRVYLSARWPNDKRAPVWTKRGRPSWYRP